MANFDYKLEHNHSAAERFFKLVIEVLAPARAAGLTPHVSPRLQPSQIRRRMCTRTVTIPEEIGVERVEAL